MTGEQKTYAVIAAVFGSVTLAILNCYGLAFMALLVAIFLA